MGRSERRAWLDLELLGALRIRRVRGAGIRRRSRRLGSWGVVVGGLVLRLEGDLISTMVEGWKLVLEHLILAVAKTAGLGSRSTCAVLALVLATVSARSRRRSKKATSSS
jgi:hypothetical protein